MFDSLIQLAVVVIEVYSLVLLARIILSWIPNVDRSNQIVQFLYRVTEPVLEPARRVIPPIGGFDISAIIVFVGLHIVQSMLLGMAGSM